MTRSVRRSLVVRAETEAEKKAKAEKMDLDLEDMYVLFDKAVEDDAANKAEPAAAAGKAETTVSPASSVLSSVHSLLPSSLPHVRHWYAVPVIINAGC